MHVCVGGRGGGCCVLGERGSLVGLNAGVAGSQRAVDRIQREGKASSK